MKKGFVSMAVFLMGFLLLFALTLFPPHSWAVPEKIPSQQRLKVNETDSPPSAIHDPGSTDIPFSGGIPQGEREALMALYSSTDGDDWYDNSGWKTPPLHTDGFALPGTEKFWFGVTCNMENTTVLAVELSDNNLVGEIPGQLGNLANLQNLNLAFNQLEGAVAAQLGDLSNLEFLALDHNQLSDAIPEELGNLTYLGCLWLQQNDLTGGIPSELANLENLHCLALDYNRLSGSIPGELADLTALEILRLNGNDLGGSIPTGLTGLTNLGQTDIGYNALYADDEELREFLDARDPDWKRTQTVAPTDVSTQVLSDTSVRVIWTPIDYDGDAGGYRVFYSADTGGPYELFGITAHKSASSMTITELEPDTTYYFVVRTRTEPHEKNKNTVDSEYSDEVSAVTALEPSLTVISPNGYEKLTIGTAFEITWESTGEVGDVRLEYSTNNGETWAGIVRATGNDGIYLWEVPEPPSEFCRVRVSETDGQPADISNGSFSIRVPASVTVTSPDGGEQLTVGTIHQITWTSAGDLDDVKIEYSATSGETWAKIISTTPNDGSYMWAVPDTPSDGCLVRITGIDEDEGPVDVSDAVFTIAAAQPPTIAVTSPDGAEIWMVGFEYAITWQTTGEVGNVKIEYSTNNGESWTDIVRDTENDGLYPWEVPETPSEVCRVRISEVQGEAVDTSNGAFVIVLPPSLTVTSPNGGEDLTVGSGHEITWQSTGIVGTVMIEYSTNNGETWAPVVTSTPNDGSHLWEVPETPSDYCLIRISGCDSDGGPADVSDAVFSIIFG